MPLTDLDRRPQHLFPSNPKDEVRNQRAIRSLLLTAGKPRSVLEVFGGVGGMTKVVRRLWPSVAIESWDTSPECIALLRQAVPDCNAVVGDGMRDAQVCRDQGVMLDPHMFTLRRKDEDVFASMFSRIFRGLPAWVQINDSASGKLHINYRSYGAADGTMSAYLAAYDVWLSVLTAGRYRVKCQYGHFRAAQILIVRDDWDPLTYVEGDSRG